MKNKVIAILLAATPVLTAIPASAQSDAVVRPPARTTVEVVQSEKKPNSNQSVTPASFQTDLRPPARSAGIPRTRWQHKEGHDVWTRSALSALKTHGAPLVEMVPRDIATWCPAYPDASDAQRRAFWVGFTSALAKHESTYKATAVGGGGLWYGLLQILPATARWRNCSVGTGEALKNGSANLSCAIRIMAITVPRDGVIHGYKGKRGQGVTADWGPMHSAAKRRDMAGWLRQQTYCKPIASTRPKVRPAALIKALPETLVVTDEG